MALSPHEVKLALLDTSSVFQCLMGKMEVVLMSVFSSAYGSKNKHFSLFSLAALNVSKFRPKYDTDHSDCTNMFLDGEIKACVHYFLSNFYFVTK